MKPHSKSVFVINSVITYEQAVKDKNKSKGAIYSWLLSTFARTHIAIFGWRFPFKDCRDDWRSLRASGSDISSRLGVMLRSTMERNELGRQESLSNLGHSNKLQNKPIGK